MNTRSAGKAVQLARAVYGIFLFAYPRSFRRRFGAEMDQLFRDQLREAMSRYGMVAIVRFALQTGGDLLFSIGREWAQSLSCLTVACLFISMATGCYAGYVDQHNATETYPVLAISLAGCFLLGSGCPRHAWRWAVVVGACTAFAPFAAPGFGGRLMRPGSWAILLIVLVPATIGAYAGSLLRSAARGFN